MPVTQLAANTMRAWYLWRLEEFSSLALLENDESAKS